MKIVACSEVQWHYVRTRKQQILGRFPSDWPILFLQAYVRRRPSAWRPRREGNVTYVTVPAFKSIPNPFLRRILDLGPVRAVLNAVLFVWVWILRAITGFGGRDTALYVSNIYYGRILPRLARRVAIYDCNDNHLAFPNTPVWARGYFERVVRGVDAVVVSQSLLREEIEPLRRDGIVEIGNGVDFDLFDAAWHAPARPVEICALPAPRIGYAGALAEWIDLELVGEIAAAFPEASVVLVGPVVGAAVDPQRHFADRPNVHWLGSKPHAQLPHYVAEMDVCLIPFRKTPLTRGVNPNKLYEYMALGKPVVSTDFSPFIHAYAPHVKVGASREAILDAVRAWLDAPGDPQPRRELARANSWARSAARMVALLDALAAGRGPQAPGRGSAPGAAASGAARGTEAGQLRRGGADPGGPGSATSAARL
ncbi:MAG: glycosyltransferase [Candidatus Krumholzibacteriia bacterium]